MRPEKGDFEAPYRMTHPHGVWFNPGGSRGKNLNAEKNSRATRQNSRWYPSEP